MIFCAPFYPPTTTSIDDCWLLMQLLFTWLHIKLTTTQPLTAQQQHQQPQSFQMMLIIPDEKRKNGGCTGKKVCDSVTQSNVNQQKITISLSLNENINFSLHHCPKASTPRQPYQVWYHWVCDADANAMTTWQPTKTNSTKELNITHRYRAKVCGEFVAPINSKSVHLSRCSGTETEVLFRNET